MASNISINIRPQDGPISIPIPCISPYISPIFSPIYLLFIPLYISYISPLYIPSRCPYLPLTAHMAHTAQRAHTAHSLRLTLRGCRCIPHSYPLRGALWYIHVCVYIYVFFSWRQWTKILSPTSPHPAAHLSLLGRAMGHGLKGCLLADVGTSLSGSVTDASSRVATAICGRSLRHLPIQH